MSTFGTIAGSAARTQRYFQSASPDDLQTQVNDYLASLLGPSPAQALSSITLAGAGDGHTFVVVIESAAEGDVNGGFLNCTTRFYIAADAAELAVARSAVSAGIASNPLADEQLAGASKGTQFMGMVVIGTPRIPA